MRPPLAQMRGQEVDIAVQAGQIIYFTQILVKLIGFHTSQPIEQTETDSDRDHWFSAAEAKDYDFIDSVVEHTTNASEPLA